MNINKRSNLALIILVFALSCLPTQSEEVYHHFFGNTHSHTSYSDGGTSTPAEHFSLAKSLGYDFYAITDHALAKYTNFTPQSYEETKRQADLFTDDKFVGIAGFEFSENDGPGGKGHLNALNSAGYLDATGTSVDLPKFYDWLVTGQSTTVAASFNHAGETQYNSFDYFTTARRNPITMFEMINSGNLHYGGFLAALNKGWRVAPIAGQDGHGTWRIPNHHYRTGVLAKSLTREDLMQAMRARRVYCTWDENLRVTFSANGQIMGSVISKPSTLNFRINVYDPDTTNTGDPITKLEIVGENGALVGEKSFSSHTASWNPTFPPQHRYYFVKVYTADKTDGPTAYSAPIWIDNTAVTSVSGARLAPNNTPVDITGAPVSAAWEGLFYIESDDRSSGIQVLRASHGLDAGDRADITGTAQTTPYRERFIAASTAERAGSADVEPLHVTNRDLGGDSFIDAASGAGQVGVNGGGGLNNVGLFVKVSGRVSYVDPLGQFAYIDDGSNLNDGNTQGAKGIRIITTGCGSQPQGTYTTVTGISTLVTVGAKPARAVKAIPQKGVRVVGNRLYRDGKPFVPQGFTMVGLLSPTMTGTPGTAAQHYGQAELDAAKAWGANTIRFQISQRGFDPQDSLHTASYVQRVKDGVALARKNGFAVILSMQDQSYSGGDASPMPEPQTLRSWGEVPKHFNGDPDIMYELWNEPMVKDTAAEWVLWKSGGTYNGQSVIGHQQLLDCVRASGATNVLIAEGTRVGKSFIGFPGLDDPLGQLAFGIHPYLTSPILDPTSWDGYFGNFSIAHPVIATEWSANSSSSFCQSQWPTLSPQLLTYLKAHNIGVMAWAFDITDTLIKDWNWTPTNFTGYTCGVKGCGPGELVKQHFLSL